MWRGFSSVSVLLVLAVSLGGCATQFGMLIHHPKTTTTHRAQHVSAPAPVPSPAVAQAPAPMVHPVPAKRKSFFQRHHIRWLH